MLSPSLFKRNTESMLHKKEQTNKTKQKANKQSSWLEHNLILMTEGFSFVLNMLSMAQIFILSNFGLCQSDVIVKINVRSL